jgi:hypothetical protein
LTPFARLAAPIENRRDALRSHSFASSAGAAEAMLADLHDKAAKAIRGGAERSGGK